MISRTARIVASRAMLRESIMNPASPPDRTATPLLREFSHRPANRRRSGRPSFLPQRHDDSDRPVARRQSHCAARVSWRECVQQMIETPRGGFAPGPVDGDRTRSFAKEQTLMRKFTRRQVVGGMVAATAATLTPLRLLAEAVKPVRIREVDVFSLDIPVSPAEHKAGLDHHYAVVRIETDAGVRGYSFAGPRGERACAKSVGCLSARTCSPLSVTCAGGSSGGAASSTRSGMRSARSRASRSTSCWAARPIGSRRT